VVTDIHMPTIDGIKLARLMQFSVPELKIVIVLAKAYVRRGMVEADGERGILR